VEEFMLGRKLGLGNESVSGIYIDDWYAAKSVVLSHLYITAIFLPRQARDKHIGKPLKKDFWFLRGSPGGPSEVEGLEAVRDKQITFFPSFLGVFLASLSRACLGKSSCFTTRKLQNKERNGDFGLAARAGCRPRKRLSGKETRLFAPFYSQNDRFAKTG
jgi:hypothetical protein